MCECACVCSQVCVRVGAATTFSATTHRCKTCKGMKFNKYAIFKLTYIWNCKVFDFLSLMLPDPARGGACEATAAVELLNRFCKQRRACRALLAFNDCVDGTRNHGPCC